jgi:hypothetical protein
MSDVSIADLIAKARLWAASPLLTQAGICPLLEDLADALEASERDAQQAEDQANNLAADVAQLGRELSERTMQRNEWASRMMELANITIERDALTEQLAAAQAVIAEGRELADAIERESHCSYLGRDIRAVLDQSPTDALEAVKHDAWREGFARAQALWPSGEKYSPVNPHPAKTEGEKL